MIRSLIPSISLLSIIVIGTAAWMILQGKVYRNKLRHCREVSGFCGLDMINLHLPDPVRARLDRLASSPAAKRVDIGSWKAGRTVSCSDLARYCPDAVSWYQTRVREAVSEAIGHPVDPTPLDLPTSACLLVYDRPGDHIDWHFDVNYYTGRFFTVLVPVTWDATSTRFVWRDAWSTRRQVDIPRGKALVFEGDLVFHGATKIGPGERRVVLSMQFSTDPRVSVPNRILRRIKDVAYIGFS